MEPVQHQMMGYDRAITMFSPDGRLLQVEYAKRTVRLGNTAIGMACKDGVILVTDKRLVDKLVVPESVEKIFKIDDHVMATGAGILSDARVLIERAQLKAQQHRVEYDSPIDCIAIVKDLCNLKQYTTQSGGLRPFGVSLLIAGIDESGMSVYETDPTGLFYQYKATVIGEGETDVEEMLHKEYKDSMTMEEGLKLAFNMLKKALADNFKIDRVDAAIIPVSTGIMERVSKERLEKLTK